MQLSPPFQLPQPVGAVARGSDGIEVGIIGGSKLGETVPVTVFGEVVVEACETLVLADVDVETCVVLVAAVVEVATGVI